MPHRLGTPLTHKLFASPLGDLAGHHTMERAHVAQFRHDFALRRVRAAAEAADGDVDTFLDALDADVRVPLGLRPGLAGGLRWYEAIRRDRQRVIARWEQALWAPTPRPSPAVLAARDAARRDAGERALRPILLFGGLAMTLVRSPVRDAVPTPADVAARHADALADPDALYRPPDAPPRVEESAHVPGPAGVEYLVRFPSPAPWMGDDVHARVYEPQAPPEDVPTLVFGSGLGVMHDCVPYWPEEAFAGRALAARGLRVVLPESPWHGRREAADAYSGEPYLATAPVGTFRLHAAAAREMGVLVAWARGKGAAAVGVGGFSMSGITALHVAGRAGSWPEAARPDLVVALAGGARVDRILLEGRLARALGTTRALKDAGWSEDTLARLGPLLNPPTRPGIAPDRVLAFLGKRDDTALHAPTRAALRAWGVPRANVTVWDTAHFGALLAAVRGGRFQERVARALDAAARGFQDSLPSRPSSS